MGTCGDRISDVAMLMDEVICLPFWGFLQALSVASLASIIAPLYFVFLFFFLTSVYNKQCLFNISHLVLTFQCQ